MAERVLQHITVIPAGTTVAAPHVEELGFSDWEVEQIDLIVPSGPSGTMGFYLANNELPWVPRALGEWLIMDDQTLTVIPTGYPNGTGWEIVGYNLGAYDHQVTALFHVNPIASPADRQPQLPVLTFIERAVTDPPPVVL